MVGHAARAELCEALAALKSGQLSQSGFDKVYFRLRSRSSDQAIIAIGDDVVGTTICDYLGFLPHWDRQGEWPAEALPWADQCCLFLRSGLEYQWPPQPSLWWAVLLRVLAFVPGGGVSMFTVIMAPVMALSNGQRKEAAIVALIGVAAVAPGLGILGG